MSNELDAVNNTAPDTADVQTQSPDSSMYIQPQDDQQQMQVQAQPAQPAQPAQQPSKWQAILTGALVGLAGGAGQKNFAAGLGGGAQASLNYSQQQKQNAVQQQQVDMEKQRLALQTQQSADEHQTAMQNLAVSQANLAILHTQYALMPKTVQDQLNQQDMQMGQTLKGEGVPIISGQDGMSYQDAQQRIMAERNANPNSALQFVMHSRADGKYDVFQVTDPNKTNDSPMTVTIGYDATSGKPIVKQYAAHSITLSQMQSLETNAAVNYANQTNELKTYAKKSAIDTSAAGTRAYAEEAGRNRADMESLGGNGNNTDPFGNPVGRPGMNLSTYNKTVTQYTKDYGKDLNQLDQASSQLNGIIQNAEQTGRLPGAASVVGLFDAIGISSQPLKGRGFRISNEIVGEHTGARNIWQTMATKLQRVAPDGTGQVVTLQQLKDYANILNQSRHDAYVGAANQAVNQGIGVQTMPRGNGQPIDPSTAQIFLTVAGNDASKARTAATKFGWKF